MGILILCPLPMELENLANGFRDRRFVSEEERVGPLHLLRFPRLDVRLSLAGHGKTQAGIQTQFLLDHMKGVKAVFFAGCAGAIDPEVKIGDVVVGEKTIEHDFHQLFIKKPLPEFTADPGLVSTFRSVSPNNFALHFGAIASGDEDILHSDRAHEIHQTTNALAVAWEGAGGARACRFHKIPFVEIRGITDSAGPVAIKDFPKHLKVAMENVASVFAELLSV
jgi:adenosylhomocysteine nucleosidase